jgi:alkylhydroperoxidase family enzyme
MDPRYADKLRDLERRVLDQPGTLDPSVRRAAADGGTVPEAVAGYADKVRRAAYTVTDEEVAHLLATGWTQDQLFELTVAAAFGAARRRLQIGLDAMAPVDVPEEI